VKIKKVEIQSFRVYDNVNRSTFDFMTELNEVAGFVSIHAPNGFGKTSFYDAVEWAFTNKITRYDRRRGFNSDLAKSERVNSTGDDGKRKHQLILRNKFSDLEEGFVNLYTTLGDIPYSRIIPKVKKGEPDYKFEAQKIEQGTEHFHEVMLSQEWIDAFLKEDDAEIRYEKFVSSFGDVSLNKKYNAVINLISLNKAKVKSLRVELKDLSEDTEVEYDSNLLALTNKEIGKVNVMNCNFPLITPSFSEEDDYLFINLIKDKLEELSNEINNNEVMLRKINLVKSGSSQEQIGLKSYFTLRDKLVENELELKKLNKLKDSFNERLDKQEKVKEIKKLASLNQEQTSEYESLIKIVPQYDVIESKIKNINSELSTMDYSRVEAKSSLEDKKDEHKELTSKLQIENSVLNKLLSKKNYFPKTFKSIDENNEKTIALDVAINTDKNLLKAKITDIETAKSTISNIESAIKTIEKDIYSLEGNINFEIYGESILAIENQVTSLKDIKNNIVSVNSKIEKIDSLNNELKELLDLGVKVINGSEMSECPLCQCPYESYAELSSKVSNNPLLKDELGKLVEERSELQNKYDHLASLQEINKTKLLSHLNALLKNEKTTLNREKASLGSLKASVISNQTSIERLELESEKLKLSVDNLSMDKYLLSVSYKISSQTKEFERVEASLKLINSKITKDEESFKLFEVQLSNAKERIELLKKEPDFQKIKSFSNKEALSDEGGYFNTLKTLVTEKNQDMTKYKIEVDQLNTEIDKLSLALPSSDLSYYASKVIEIEVIIKNILTELAKFEIFIKSNLNINGNEVERADLEKLLEENIEVCISIIDSLKNFKGDIEKLERYKTNVIPFLKSEENKKDRRRLEAEITLLDNTVNKELGKEKTKLSKFINKQIESFFYQRLINSLYKKIDPHPRYNKISFKCDFSQDKPKLNVFVSNDCDDDSIVPTLYFSTAQLNILSLSIFLAKALNTTDSQGKPIDCIFIDDPIQSMDSINILSTIDLFRSIVTNMGKQIILSTHDESFQNLLKKKMPEKLFKSKFIEFETFGKLKAG
jgi:exonuclease SbcC